MIVEIFRLLFTLATTAVGFLVGSAWLDWFPSSSVDRDVAVVTGAIIGAGIGYVVGGALGRFIDKGIQRAPLVVSRATAPQLFGGGFGVITGICAGSAVAIPLVALTPGVVGWPLGTLVVFVSGVFFGRVFSARAGELVDLLAGVGDGAAVLDATAEAAVGDTDSARTYLLDSAAAIDGRVLELARSGLVGPVVFVPAFVVDELQGIADSGDASRRRRGRRGLDVLDAIRTSPGVDFAVLEDTVPDHVEVDAKLLSLAGRRDAVLVTTDHNLSRAAGLRGISVLNPHALGESLRPGVSAGDIVDVVLEKPGSEPGQGVGFLDDGTMVVVNEAADLIGQTVEVEVSNILRTSVGRMAFGRIG